jgi:hypothetical protein
MSVGALNSIEVRESSERTWWRAVTENSNGVWTDHGNISIRRVDRYCNQVWKLEIGNTVESVWVIEWRIFEIIARADWNVFESVVIEWSTSTNREANKNSDRVIRRWEQWRSLLIIQSSFHDLRSQTYVLRLLKNNATYHQYLQRTPWWRHFRPFHHLIPL